MFLNLRVPSDSILTPFFQLYHSLFSSKRLTHSKKKKEEQKQEKKKKTPNVQETPANDAHILSQYIFSGDD